MADRPLRVLILDEAFVSGAVAALGLRGAGCHVHVLSAAGGRGGCRTERLTCELVDRGTEHLLRRAQTLTSRGGAGFDVVYPVTEPMMMLAWNAGGAWHAPVFPEISGVHRALFTDKRRMSEAVRRAGVPVPDEHDASSDVEVARGVRMLGLPVVVKGSVGRGGSATVIARTERAVRRAAERLRVTVPEVYLQRWIDGATYLVGGVFDRGSPLRLFAARKTMQHPRYTGPAAELLSVRDETLVSSARQAFAAAEVTGIASADFIVDREGRAQFLELNPRPWGSMAAAESAGVDLFSPLVSLMRGESVTPELDFAAGVRTATVPLYLASTQMWRSGAALRALREDVPRAISFVRRDPALATHLAHRCARVVLNWGR